MKPQTFTPTYSMHTHTQTIGPGASAGAAQAMQEDTFQQSSSSSYNRHDSFDQPPGYDQTWDEEEDDWESQQQEAGGCGLIQYKNVIKWISSSVMNVACLGGGWECVWVCDTVVCIVIISPLEF